jgi:hypothetical protein
LNALGTALLAQFGQARLFEASARNGTGLEAWFEPIVATTQTPRQVMNVDYEVSMPVGIPG